ncbi:unnamed protein product [Linum tenue]|uniref:DUF4408 domain-containing protein n=1 Tax=Linum tenue TaxID=586396 RepID=A0AAV0S6K7_9ROSI|nr:unnamed protein product [Linum tenue]
MNSLMIVGCALLLYTPTKQFLFLHLPNVLSCLSSPKCVFVLVNVIVVYLVGESRLSGHEGSSRRSSRISDVYDEYVGRARAQRERGIVVVDDETTLFEDEAVESESDSESVIVVDEITTSFEDEIVEQEEQKEKGGRGAGDELNRRIEDFIARVNRQRQLEIQSLVSCKA